MDTTQFGGAFWITITGVILGFLGTMVTFCLKSKCKECDICFGAVKIVRDVEAENREEQMLLEKGINPFSLGKSGSREKM